MIDYRDWTYRFLGIYRYSNRAEVSNVPQAIRYLEEQQFDQEKLDKIWRGHLEKNLYRDKMVRNKKSITRDTANLYKYFKEEHWDNPIPSVIESLAEELDDKQKCPECQKEGKINFEFLHMDNKQHRCSWHFSKLHYNEGPTGLNKLREAHKNRIPKNPEESFYDYIKRTLKQKRTLEPDTGTRQNTKGLFGGLEDQNEWR